MRNTLFGLTTVAVLAGMIAPTQADPSWSAFVIRNATVGGAPPQINYGPSGYPANAVEFVISASGMKAAWGSSLLDGTKVGNITEISIQRLDDYTRFTAGSGPYVAPYFNIWITDGAGKYAVIANEPSNAEWTGLTRWNMDWDTLKTKTLKVYENSDKSWLPNNGVGLTFQDVAAYTIQAPTVAELTAGWAGLGSGAPRELGTNLAYGFNWVFGDTLSNYVSGDPGYVVANPIIPAPGAVVLGMIGFGLIGWVKRRFA